MAPDKKIPDVDTLKKLGDEGFANAVCAALRRCDMQAPAFNLAAKAKSVVPEEGGRTLRLYPAEAQGLILSGVKALREYGTSGRISNATREEFILADTRDILRGEDADLRDKVMNYISSRLTAISTLALAPPLLPRRMAPKP